MCVWNLYRKKVTCPLQFLKQVDLTQTRLHDSSAKTALISTSSTASFRAAEGRVSWSTNQLQNSAVNDVVVYRLASEQRRGESRSLQASFTAAEGRVFWSIN